MPSEKLKSSKDLIKKATRIAKRIKEKVHEKWRPEHSAFGHHYRHIESGVLMDSVTTKNILEKPHLTPWAIKLAIEFLEVESRFQRLAGPERKELIMAAQLAHRDVRDDAGTIGGMVHDIVDRYIKDWMRNGKPISDIRSMIPVSLNYRVYGACRSAEAVFKKYEVIPVASEICVGDPKVGAGTLDLVVMNKEGGLEIWDWKSSNSVDDFYAQQVVAYGKFFTKMTRIPVADYKIFKLDKFSDRFKVYTIPDPKGAYTAFKALSKVYNWRENKQEKLVEIKNTIKL